LLPRKILLLHVLIAVAIVTAFAGCGDPASDTSTAPPAAKTAKTYSTSPASTSELLKDASDAIRTGYDAGTGVHFKLDTTTNAGGGQSDYFRSEGDMRFPAGVSMTSNNYLSPQPVFVDSILVDGKIYFRTAGGEWKSGAANPSPPDPRMIAEYLDYTRSSTNFGRETLKDGRATWHVQVDVDMALLAHRLADENASDPELARAYQTLRTAVVRADYWIGAEDQLPYQMLVRYSNPDTGVTQEQKFVFSEWGETVEIDKPCENC